MECISNTVQYRFFFVLQEECNKSGSDADGDEDGDEGDVSDNVSTTVAEPSGQFHYIAVLYTYFI